MARQLVLAVATDLVLGSGISQGFTRGSLEDVRPLVTAARYLPRDELEEDPRQKQVIPYVVLTYQDRVFAYRRGRGSSEKRLVALTSVGIGGHLEWSDDSLFGDALTGYLRGARREVEEEIVVSTTWTERVAGFINDDSSDVGRVHLGVVHVWDLAEPAVRPRERKIAGAGFKPTSSVAKLSDLEGWARYALAALDAGRST